MHKQKKKRQIPLYKIKEFAISLQRPIWQQWHNPSGKTSPVFLVGCGRSGSTMLLFQLSKSWQVDGFNENHPTAFQKFRLQDLAVIDTLVQKSRARVAMFKPVLDTYRTATFLSRYPTTRVLFIFRHYDDVINSSMKKFGDDNRLNHVRAWVNEDFCEFALVPPPAQSQAYVHSLWQPSLTPASGAAIYWLFQNRLFYDLGLHEHERVRLVSYEHLVSSPQDSFAAICDFLGIRFQSYMASGVFASSINKRQPRADVEAGIRSECEALWQRLNHHAGVLESPETPSEFRELTPTRET